MPPVEHSTLHDNTKTCPKSFQSNTRCMHTKVKRHNFTNLRSVELSLSLSPIWRGTFRWPCCKDKVNSTNWDFKFWKDNNPFRYGAVFSQNMVGCRFGVCRFGETHNSKCWLQCCITTQGLKAKIKLWWHKSYKPQAETCIRPVHQPTKRSSDKKAYSINDLSRNEMLKSSTLEMSNPPPPRYFQIYS